MVGLEFKKILPALVAAIVLLAGGAPAQAISMKECSVKYKAAQAAGTSGDLNWKEFRKQQCSKDAPVALDDTTTGPGGVKTETKPDAAEASDKGKALTFPSEVSSKYAAEKPAKARMHTCLDQYRINKGNNTLDGMRWIEKGGGYYKLCNNKLKGV